MLYNILLSYYYLFFLIETFDVINTTVEPIDRERVYLMSFFLQNSAAGGVLYVFIYIDEQGNVNYSKSIYYPVCREEATSGVDKTVPNGTYRLLSFDIEVNYALRMDSSPAYINNEFVLDDSDYEG